MYCLFVMCSHQLALLDMLPGLFPNSFSNHLHFILSRRDSCNKTFYEFSNGFQFYRHTYNMKIEQKTNNNDSSTLLPSHCKPNQIYLLRAVESIFRLWFTWNSNEIMEFPSAICREILRFRKWHMYMHCTFTL